MEAPSVVTEREYEYGDKITTAAPTLCVQSSDTKAESPCCQRCLKPVGGIIQQLMAQTRQYTLADLFQEGQSQDHGSSSSSCRSSVVSELICCGKGFESKTWLSSCCEHPVFCPHACGEVYCSKTCKDLAWKEHHRVMCVGPLSEDAPIYKFKVLTLTHGLPIFELAAKVVVMLASGKDFLPCLTAKANDVLPFWEYAAEFSENLSPCYRYEVEMQNLDEDAVDWLSVTKEAWSLLQAALEDSKSRGQHLSKVEEYRSKDFQFFGKLVTWLDLHCMSVEHLSVCGKYLNYILSNCKSGDILKCMEEFPLLRQAFEAGVLTDGDDVVDDDEEEEGREGGGEGGGDEEINQERIEMLQRDNGDGEVMLPSVRGLVFWEEMPSFPHACKPSVCLTFDPFESLITFQANHLLQNNAPMTRCYYRLTAEDVENEEGEEEEVEVEKEKGGSHHDAIKRFIERNGIECVCNTCKTREYLLELSSSQDSTESQASTLDTLAQLAFDEERYDDACTLYEKRLASEETDGETWHKYGRALLNMGLWSKGYEAWEKGSLVDPEHKELETLMKANSYFCYRQSREDGCDGGVTMNYTSLEQSYLSQDAFLVDSVGISTEDCSQIVSEAESYARLKNGWSTKRHYSVPTTDIPVHELPLALSILNRCLEKSVFPAIADKFDEKIENLRVHDAFVIKYAMDGQKFLPIHTDQSHYSGTIGLNSLDEYGEGGIVFVGNDPDDDECVVRVDKGQGLLFKGGDLSHGGRHITSGTRYIIALFIFTV